MRTSPMYVLERSEMRAIALAAIDCGLHEPEKRPLLLGGIPREITARLSIGRSSLDQLELDLLAFASATSGQSDEHPLLTWLDNAIHLSEGRPAQSQLESFRQQVSERLATGYEPALADVSQWVSVAPRSAKKLQLSGIVVIAIALVSLSALPTTYSRAILSVAAIGLFFFIFGQLFAKLELIPEDKRAQTIVAMAATFGTLIMACTALALHYTLEAAEQAPEVVAHSLAPEPRIPLTFDSGVKTGTPPDLPDAGRPLTCTDTGAPPLTSQPIDVPWCSESLSYWHATKADTSPTTTATSRRAKPPTHALAKQTRAKMSRQRRWAKRHVVPVATGAKTGMDAGTPDAVQERSEVAVVTASDPAGTRSVQDAAVQPVRPDAQPEDAAILPVIIAQAPPKLHPVVLQGLPSCAAEFEKLLLEETESSGGDLRECNLSRRRIDWKDLREVDLSGVSLAYSNLEGTRLDGANLTGANLTGANCSLAKLDHAKLRDASLHQANFSTATLLGADLRGVDLRTANLERANLSRADLRGAHLPKTGLLGIESRFVVLDKTTRIPEGLTLQDIREGNYSGLRVRGLRSSGGNFVHQRLDRVDLPLAVLEHGKFSGVSMQGARLLGANLMGARLEGANMQGADLRRASLRGANLEGADLRDVDFRDADLRGANLGRAQVKGAQFQGAKYSTGRGFGGTKFPSGLSSSAMLEMREID